MENDSPYKHLAERLNALPNGFPPTSDGSELRLLAKLFTPEEADLATQLRLTPETPSQVAERISADSQSLNQMLKSMARRGLITVERTDAGLAYGLMPFVVGIYEMQNGRIDAELAQLFEDYYQRAFSQVLTVQPAVHRIIPIGESIRKDMEVLPFESASTIIARARAWGVVDCICRVQKALIGQPCSHPIDVCMIMSHVPGVFDNKTGIRALSQEEAQATLLRAAEAGLVHSTSNNQQGIDYICNCCTCSCGILRGMAELKIANVVARSVFVNQVDEVLCIACGLCVEKCQFNALEMQDVVEVNRISCVGCGVCVLACPEGALALVRRPDAEIMPIPETTTDWRAQRAQARGIDLNQVM
jgi:Na+-translocating ferredoxin:NAD+ oxidoreductase subunit B